MIAKNIKVLKEVDLLKNFRNSFYHFFSTFCIIFFQCISLILCHYQFPGRGGGRKGGEGKKEREKYKNEVSRRSLFCSY